MKVVYMAATLAAFLACHTNAIKLSVRELGDEPVFELVVDGDS